MRSIATLLLLVALTGCTTMSSTALVRTPDDMLFVNKFTSLFGKTDRSHVKGVPITLNVPTHTDAYIIETYYVQKSNDGQLVALPQERLGRRNLHVDLKSVMTPKIFTVDFKRPAAGSLVYDLRFQTGEGANEQYFQSFANRIEDETIRDITAAIGTLKPVLAGTPTSALSANLGNDVKKQLIENTRVVAYARFDISEPDYEQRLACFIDEHLNCCHACQSFPAPVAESPSTCPLNLPACETCPAPPTPANG